MMPARTAAQTTEQDPRPTNWLVIVPYVLLVIMFGVSAWLATRAFRESGKVKVSYDAGKQTFSLEAEGRESLPILEALDKAWEANVTATRATLGGWGLTHHFMDVEDLDARAKFGLVLGTDLPGLLQILERDHRSAWSDIRQLAIKLESLTPTEKRTTDVVFDRSLRGGDLIFHRDDGEWFRSHLGQECTLFWQRGAPKAVRIVKGVDLKFSKRVEISEDLFVEIQAQGAPLPAPRTPGWKASTDVGVLTAAELHC